MSHLEAGWKFWPALLGLSPGFPHPPAHLPSTHTYHLAARRICLLFPLPCALGPSYGWATSAKQSLKQPRGLPACPSWLEKPRPWGKGSHRLMDYRGLGDLEIVFPRVYSDGPESKTSFIICGAQHTINEMWSLLFKTYQEFPDNRICWQFPGNNRTQGPSKLRPRASTQLAYPWSQLSGKDRAKGAGQRPGPQISTAQILTGGLAVIAKGWKQPKCLSADEYRNKIRYPTR